MAARYKQSASCRSISTSIAVDRATRAGWHSGARRRLRGPGWCACPCLFAGLPADHRRCRHGAVALPRRDTAVERTGADEAEPVGRRRASLHDDAAVAVGEFETAGLAFVDIDRSRIRACNVEQIERAAARRRGKLGACLAAFARKDAHDAAIRRNGQRHRALAATRTRERETATALAAKHAGDRVALA